MKDRTKFFTRGIGERRRWAAIAIAIAVTLATTAGTLAPRSANPLASRQNLSVLREGHELTHAPAVAAAQQQAYEYLSTTAVATTSAGKTHNLADLPDYVNELGYSNCIQAAGSDPYHPRIFMADMARWRSGLDNPDTIYRDLAVSPDASYVVRGRRNTSTYVAFQLLTGFYGINGQTPQTVGFLDNSQLKVSQDGSFVITLDSTPANGQPNHIQLPPNAGLLLIRDTLNNWSQEPMDLSVQRIAPQHVPAPPTMAVLAQRCADWLVSAAPYWYATAANFNLVPVNTLSPARPTANGLTTQYSSAGHFQLTADQALVITVRPYGTQYLGFELGSDWFISIDYVHHTSSLNGEQAIPNPDGSYTYVVSLKDPGVWNWLDPDGHPTGSMFVRWQGLPGPLPAGYTPTVQLVNLANLANVLPPSTAYANAAARAEQIYQRQSGIRHRLAGIPQRLLTLNPFQPIG